MSSTSHGVSESKASEWPIVAIGIREENANRWEATRVAENRCHPVEQDDGDVEDYGSLVQEAGDQGALCWPE